MTFTWSHRKDMVQVISSNNKKMKDAFLLIGIYLGK